MTPERGKFYRLEKGKGYGKANWWVLSLDGRVEVAGGLLYEDAKWIFDRSEVLMLHTPERKKRCRISTRKGDTKSTSTEVKPVPQES